MKKLMTKQFSKWASKQNIPTKELATALAELQAGSFDANLGGHIYKKRIRFKGQRKSSSGRTIICYKKGRGLFLFTGSQKMKNQTYQRKNGILHIVLKVVYTLYIVPTGLGALAGFFSIEPTHKLILEK